MKRRHSPPRNHWQSIVESQGLHFHTPRGQPEGIPYWDESVYYSFEPSQIEALESCTYWLNEACLKACEEIIHEHLFTLVGIPEPYVDWVKRSWERDERTIYGRFDLWYNGYDSPKLLEYNADTPTSLLEAAVIQWYWLKDCHPQSDQFNTIHERLLEVFKTLKAPQDRIFYFSALADNLEDFMTASYLRDVAMQSGWKTEFLSMESLGWDPHRRRFTDLADRTISNIFKLYPWEWMINEPFGRHLLLDTTQWWEPPWKMLLSNKGLLPILHQMFPDSPYLLPASFEPMEGNHVKKPLHGREGSNIELVLNQTIVGQTDGPYRAPFIYQEARPLPCFDGFYPVLGSWMVNGHACGIGIREDSKPITGNTSRFVPHIFC